MSRPPTHGKTGTPTHCSWLAMRARCLSPSAGNYGRYGAKKITICGRWEKFVNFLADMGERPDGATLDRIDGSKGYKPENCRWATPKEQATNRSTTVMITFNGETLCQTDWAKRIGINVFALKRRLISGWSIHDALTLPRQPVNWSRKTKFVTIICAACGIEFEIDESTFKRRGAKYCSRSCR